MGASVVMEDGTIDFIPDESVCQISGEIRVRQAILLRSILDIIDDKACLLTANPERTRREAWEWILSDERQWPGSFVRICEVLHLSATNIRTRLLRMQMGGESINWHKIDGRRASVR